MAPRIIFIHGIGGKPEEPQYLKQWIEATRLGLKVQILDDAFSMAYWAHLRGEEAAPDVEREIVRSLPSQQRRFLMTHGSRKARHLSFWQNALSVLFRWTDEVFRRFLDRYIDDVYNYFYRDDRRQQIKAVLERELRAAGQDDKIALLSHSMGTVIALDVLKGEKYPIDLFVTMGSPLGIEWIKDKLGRPDFPAGVGRWLNVFDRADPVSFDPDLADDYKKDGREEIEDRRVRDNFSDKGKRDPHHWHGYLSSDEVASALEAFWQS